MYKNKELPILCSACLLGFPCRYDGKSQTSQKMIKIAKTEFLLPICPEFLGGLPTPRKRNELKGDKVFNVDGKDLTAVFKKAAIEVIRIVKKFKIKKAYMKSRSPSCGCGKIYDGSFSGKLIKGDGITVRLLKAYGVEVIPID